MNTNVQQLIGDVQQARQRMLQAVHMASTEQGAFKPTPDDWSIAEILEHLVLVEQSIMNALWKAADKMHHGQPGWQGEFVHRGRPAAAVFASMWGAGVQAPPFAMPRWGGPVSYWSAAFDCCQPLLDAFAAQLPGLNLDDLVLPHPILGPLDTWQWLAFLRFHLDVHCTQVESVMRAPGYPV